MSKEKAKKKLSNREMNAFPFLSMPLGERLQKAGSVDLTGNYIISEDGDYCTIRPVNPEKGKRRGK
jgi:hypothetical protein